MPPGVALRSTRFTGIGTWLSLRVFDPSRFRVTLAELPVGARFETGPRLRRTPGPLDRRGSRRGGRAQSEEGSRIVGGEVAAAAFCESGLLAGCRVENDRGTDHVAVILSDKLDSQPVGRSGFSYDVAE